MSSTYIIGEAGSNHNGSFLTALNMIDAAKEAGCDAVKFQIFKSQNLYASNTPDFADYKQINKMMKDLELPQFWIPDLMEHCNKVGIEFMATPFHKSAVDYLHNEGVCKLKISGFESTDVDFVEYVLDKQRPTIITTGIGHNLKTIHNLVHDVIIPSQNDNVTLLHCNHSYPTPYEDLNLNTIPEMIKRFGEYVDVGFSDHTKEILAPIIAVSKGATVIEKHFTLNSAQQGPDHHFALEPGKLKKMVENIRWTEKASGIKSDDVEFSYSEYKYRNAMRGVYATQILEPGMVLSNKNVTTKRPLRENGVPASKLSELYGKKINKQLLIDNPIMEGDTYE